MSDVPVRDMSRSVELMLSVPTEACLSNGTARRLSPAEMRAVEQRLASAMGLLDGGPAQEAAPESTPGSECFTVHLKIQAAGLDEALDLAQVYMVNLSSLDESIVFLETRVSPSARWHECLPVFCESTRDGQRCIEPFGHGDVHQSASWSWPGDDR